MRELALEEVCIYICSHTNTNYKSAEVFAGSRMAHTATALSPLLTVPITLDLLHDTVNEVGLLFSVIATRMWPFSLSVSK